MRTVVELVDQENVEEIHNWENFLLENEGGTILQSPLMGEVFRASGFDWNLVIAKQDGRLVGGAFSTIWPGDKFGFLGKFSTFKTTYGPIVGTNKDKETIAFMILKKIEETIVKRGGMKHIILSKDFWMQTQIESLQYKIDPHIVGCTFLIDLRKSEDELWRALSVGVRRYIRKAEKCGVHIIEAQKKETPLIMHSLHLDNYRRVKIPPNPLSFFRSVWENLEKKGHAKSFFAYYEGRPVAGVTVLVDERMMYAYVGGSLEEALRLEANKLLHWHLIRWGAKQGYSFYDLLFAPSGKYEENPSWGIYLFKRNLGGLEIPVCYYERIYSAKKALLWSRLMIPVYSRLMSVSQAF